MIIIYTLGYSDQLASGIHLYLPIIPLVRYIKLKHIVHKLHEII